MEESLELYLEQIYEETIVFNQIVRDYKKNKEREIRISSKIFFKYYQLFSISVDLLQDLNEYEMYEYSYQLHKIMKETHSLVFNIEDNDKLFYKLIEEMLYEYEY
jgi:hypothetical protein